MNITLFVTKRCTACDRVRTTVERISGERKDVELHVEDIKEARPQGIVIVPALFIEDELYSYGDIDENKFLESIEMDLSKT
jgi:glutaredoxin